VTFYPEPNLVTAATQGICFLSNGTWLSTTFSNWKGDWFLKGDRLRWYGHTSAISTAEFGQFISNTTFNGESAHFFASATSVPPLTSSRGNYQATKVSTVCNRAASGPAKSSADPSAK
jgi:hypothetical protein